MAIEFVKVQQQEHAMSLFYHYLPIIGMSLYFYYYFITCNGLGIHIDCNNFGLRLQIALTAQLVTNY